MICDCTIGITVAIPYLALCNISWHLFVTWDVRIIWHSLERISIGGSHQTLIILASLCQHLYWLFLQSGKRTWYYKGWHIPLYIYDSLPPAVLFSNWATRHKLCCTVIKLAYLTDWNFMHFITSLGRAWFNACDPYMNVGTAISHISHFQMKIISLWRQIVKGLLPP